MRNLIGLSVASVLLGACLCELYHRERVEDTEFVTPFGVYRIHDDTLSSEGFEYGVYSPNREQTIWFVTYRDFLLWEEFPYGKDLDYRIRGLEQSEYEVSYPVEHLVGFHTHGNVTYMEWEIVGFLDWDDYENGYYFTEVCGD